MDFNIDYSLFNLKAEYFDSQSTLHGINHTYRVMCYTLYIGIALQLKHETRLTFCAAFIHDMARRHDGYCKEHGAWAAENKLPDFVNIFKKIGITNHDLSIIKAAVENHSELYELNKDNEAYMVSALLKDADALDRIRISENNLNPHYLRFIQSSELIPFAKELFYLTNQIKFISFTEVLKISESIDKLIN